MDYEKKYKEALEVAQRFYNNSAAITKKGLEDIFPELAENEDERIRKGLIEYFLHYPDHEITYYGLKADFVIAWLEKQGKNNMGISETTKKELEDNLNKALEKETPESCNEFLEKQGEQKPWSEEDEAIYYGVIETEQYMLDVVNGIKKFNVGNISIKEECTRELNWLKSLKDKCLPQPKQEWSEEDERSKNAAIQACKYMVDNFENSTKQYDDAITWLKSLRPQKQWKPSEEQIEALDFAADCVVPAEFCYKRRTLKELLEQLKKLREK